MRFDLVSLLSERERRQLLVEWNATERAYPADVCVHELFEAQADRTPVAVAVSCEGEQLSYGELNAQANRLARHLRTLGVGPDVRVGVCLERSVEMVVALLAVLKAGGAYVPLDPGYPIERLSYLVQDSAPALVLTHGPVGEAVHELLRGRVPVLDVVADAERWSREQAGNPDRAGLSERNLAYVIYTSGSTGQPKGAMNEHRAVVNRLLWTQETYGLSADDAVLQKTPFSFDVSVWEFFWPLLSGARLVMARPEGHKDPDYLTRVVREQRITTLHFVPSMLQFFLEHEDSAACTTLTNVICSGEALPKSVAQRFYERLPEVQLSNLYGPTEAAVDVTWWLCPKDNLPENIPIGRPVANTRMYVVDAQMEPVPVGVTGDLYIGGVQVGRGYLNRAELTAERFVSSPFVEGDRLYKTGDLARYLPSGDIEFLGRSDFQVKIRGFRIELGEIEARLAEYPGVREAVVVALDGVEGEKRLVAYYTAEPAAEISVDALRGHVLALLPAYMVPAAYVQLDAMPLSPNGKLDRKALPPPEGDAYGTRAYEAPEGELEIALAAIWRELLKVEQVGRSDNFFELGGHSLLAMRVLSRVRQALHVEASLTNLFAHPTLSGFAEAVKNSSGGALPAIVPVDRSERIPLSFAQERLWFLAQLDPAASRAYHIPFGMPIKDEVDAVALRRALDEIVARHEALRTTFAAVDGEPVQRFAPADSGFALVEHDLRGSDDVAGELKRLSMQETGAPFDLETGPLIRGRLVTTAADDHVLLITTHHIISDGWSMGVLMREFKTLYAAYRAGEPSPLAPLAVQYADYAVWQRRWITGEVLQKQAAYWRDALASAPVLLELPTDRPRPALRDHQGARVTFAFGAELTAGLKALSRRHGTTLFMTLLAAWGTLLSRLSGQDDVVVGTAVANRARPEVEPLIGFFVNTLAVRLDFSGAPTVSTLLGRVKTQAIAGQEHQDLPFEQVVEVVNPPRSLSHTPLFQTMFVWQNAERGGGASPDASAQSKAPGGAAAVAAKFDLSLELTERGDRIAGMLVYATALFDRATMERYGGYFEQILAAMVADDRRQVDRIALMSDDERRRVLVDWNATERPYPADVCVHELFEAQAERTPLAVAVSCEGEQLSYGELNAQANRLARHLRALGVGPDVRVGVCLERSLEMVVALLGVLKAGGAYVPLDPSYPVERLSYLVQDSAPALVLTHGRIDPAVHELLRGHVAVLDVVADAERWSHEPASNPERAGLDARNLAYVIYTSGSTGRPKGAMNEHGAVVNRLRWGQETYGLTADDAVMQKTPFSFDISAWEFFWPLSSGARLVMARPDGHKDPHYLIGLVQEQRITTMHFVPSMLQFFLEHDEAANCTTLVNVICSGEALPKSVVQRFYERLPHVRLSNLYGPTEAAIEVTAWTCPQENLPELIPIGRPIANTRMYVLDAHMEPVPTGVTGDLYIGGVQVARGYLNRAHLTAERFVTSPFVDGERLYKTGDLARYLPSGDIDFLGRSDFQVKIRGFRIELGEIEARLAEYPGVRETVVVAHDDGAGEKRLAAYYTADAGAETSAEALRAHVLTLLPEYMVPAAFVPLDAMPLSPNGKLDRKALPAPDGVAYGTQTYEEPAGDVEETLAEIWRELLKVEQVGRNDNFFELGGHSLLAMRVLSRVRQALHIEASLTNLFSHPTLSGFAEALRGSRTRALPAITRVDRSERIPLSFAQERLWFLAQLDPAASRAYHIPFGMPIKGDVDAVALRRALDEIVARHEALRTTFRLVGGEPAQHIAPADIGFALVEHDLRGSDDAAGERKRLSMQETSAPFDLEAGPLIRGRLITSADDDHALLITAHHIISDGWSMGVLMREFRKLYAAYRAGEASPLAPLAVQYADYAAWQRRWVSGDVLQKQAAYWQQTLANAPALLEVPTDHPRPALRDHRGARVTVAFDAELTAALKALSRRHGVTLFMTVLAAWGALLSRLSGQHDVVVGTAVANRVRPEIEPLIGYFVNTLALRLDYSGAPAVGELLGRVKTQAIAGQEHQDLPFEHVVELVNPPRSLAHTPLFQTMFIWQNTERGGSASPDASPQGKGPGGAAPVSAKVDLTLELSEQGDTIAGMLAYATALFDRTTAERYGEYLRRILAAMAAEDRPQAERVSLVSDADRRKLLVDWNATERPYPADLCVHELFEAQAATSPAAVAVSCEGEQLSYAELDAQANRLARHLRTLGVGPDVRVGVCLERSVEMVVALLAVLKAGGAYVPLDPSYPMERLSYLVQDSAPALVLTHGAVSPAVQELLRARVLVLDVVADAERWSHEPANNLHRAGLGERNLAYVIYTSGSTGQPKGAMNEHRAVVNRLLWTQETYGLSADDAVLQKTPFSFDVSVWEFFWPLLSGARLVMARPEGHKDPDYLTRVVREQRITTLHFVPSMLQFFLEHEDAANCTTLTNVICSGEALPKSVAQRFYERLPQVQLSNLYGPTEAAVDVTWWLCPKDNLPENIPIGRPVANTRMYIVDAQMEPVPVGVTGDLYIGGVQVGRGYWNRPELTAERFVSSPFVEGDRLYKTGDLARYLPSGDIEFLGRSDFQVKIRGFRIELGEIEARLAEYPGVREAVVVALGNGEIEKRLVAYYTADAGAELSVDALRAHLLSALPDYMAPAAYVPLDAMPLSPNGKLDRKALPAPEGDAYAARAYEAPVGDVETALAGIWAELLEVEQVGRNDDFFELGGHSLLSMRLNNALKQIGMNLPSVATIFQHPTVKSLAEYLQAQESVATKVGAIAIRPDGGQPPVFLIHDLFGDDLYFARVAAHIDAGVPVYGLPAVPFGAPQLRSVEEIAARKVEMILAIQPAGPYRVAGWSFGGVIAYEVAAQLLERGLNVEFVGLFDSVCSPARRVDVKGDRRPGDGLHEALRAMLQHHGGPRAQRVFAPAPDAGGEQTFDEYLDAIRANGTLPRQLAALSDAELKDVCTRVAAHRTADALYAPRPIAAPVHLFAASDTLPNAGKLVRHDEQTLGWGSVVPDGRLTVVPIAGDHRSITMTHAAGLGAAVSQILCNTSQHDALVV